MNLRPYQQKMHDDINAAWANGSANVLAVLPTGGGKTVTLSHIVKEEPGASVVLAHRAELVSQISLALAREKVRHRVIGPSALSRLCIRAHLDELGAHYHDPDARTAVGSVQSVVTSKAPPDWFRQVKLWVHDEAHHITAGNLFGKAVARFPNARGLGVTATPGRADGRGLGRHADGVMDALLLGPTPRDLIDAGMLSNYRIFAPPSNLDLSAVHVTAGGEFSPPELREATKKSTVMGDIVAHYVQHAMGKSGLTFADSIENAITIAQNFREAGVSAEVLTGKTPDALRAAVIGRFKRKDLLQIVSVALIDEGFDCPGVEVVSDGAASHSFNRFAQRFGRGLRIFPGKEHMVYFDHVSNVLRHGLPDAPRVWTLDRREKRARGKPDDVIPVRTCPSCLSVYERIYRECPFCGHYPEPAGRSGPEMVDGDLAELTPDALARLRGEIDKPLVIPYSATPEVAGAVKKRHHEKQQAQAALREAMAQWGGRRVAEGMSLSQAQRRFWLTYGVDVASAQALGRADAEALTERIENDK
jgi:superfamily II DNA or RNA helicase